MSLHGSLDEQPVLVTAVVVVVNIAFNRGNEPFSACKSMPISCLSPFGHTAASCVAF